MSQVPSFANHNQWFCKCGKRKKEWDDTMCEKCAEQALFDHMAGEIATLRQRVSELEAQVAEQVACRAALNRELIREQKRLKLRDAERDALQETVDRQLDQLAAANEKVRILREYAERANTTPVSLKYLR